MHTFEHCEEFPNSHICTSLTFTGDFIKKITGALGCQKIPNEVDASFWQHVQQSQTDKENVTILSNVKIPQKESRYSNFKISTYDVNILFWNFNK